jgi:transposase
MRQVGQRGVRLSDVPGFLGIDGAKAQWDSAVRPSGERWAVPNAASGVATLVDRVQALQPTRMGLEATGGLERAVTRALATAGLPVVVVHPRQVRDGARATGQLAQTEALDARALAHCADVIRPTPRPLPDAPTQERRALLGRRQPLIGMRTAEQNRLAGTSARLTQDMAAHRTWLNAGIATLDDDLETLLRASPLWRDNDALWPSAKGMGPGCARPLRLALPALGPLTRQQSAAVVGVAPLNGDRGTLRGRRTIWGGRAPVRTVLDMGTLVATRFNPPINVFYERLLTAGQVKKVALTACMHKLLTILNAMLKHRTPWQPQEVQNEKIYKGPLDNQDSCYAPASLRLPAATDAQRSVAPKHRRGTGGPILEFGALCQ